MVVEAVAAGEETKEFNKEEILNELKKLDSESVGFLNTSEIQVNLTLFYIKKFNFLLIIIIIKELADKLQLNLKFENDDLNKKLESVEKNEKGQVNYVELIHSL